MSRSAWLTGRPKALARRPDRNALVIIAIAVVMAALFAASYSLALSRATPHHRRARRPARSTHAPPTPPPGARQDGVRLQPGDL